MTGRQRWALVLVLTTVLTWVAAGAWFLVMLLAAYGLEVVLPGGADDPRLALQAAAVALPVTAVPGTAAGLVAGYRDVRVLAPGVGGMLGATLALLLPIGTVGFFLVAIAGMLLGALAGLLVVSRGRLSPPGGS